MQCRMSARHIFSHKLLRRHVGSWHRPAVSWTQLLQPLSGVLRTYRRAIELRTIHPFDPNRSLAGSKSRSAAPTLMLQIGASRLATVLHPPPSNGRHVVKGVC